jgi:hypothetical protein
MPRVQSSRVELYQKWCREFGEVFVVEDSQIGCKPCGVLLNVNKTFQLSQHCAVTKHIRNLALSQQQQTISDVLSSKTDTLPANISVSNIMGYMYAPITSVDVERSFSVYKSLFRSNRHRLNEDNIEKL